MSHLPFRQVHLDFHTSEKIPDIALNFDAPAFADQVAKAHINSITCFARCHHGWLYYDSKKHPELIHPNLKNKNLLKEQIEELHKRGIRVPIYTTVQWDQRAAEEHPEWLRVDADGKPTAGPYEATFRRSLCINSPYRDFLKDHLEDVLTNFNADGVFLDIVQIHECSCHWCRKDMQTRGYDVTSSKARLLFATEMMAEFKADISECIHSLQPEAQVYYNGHIGPDIPDVLNSYDHLEVESLPTGGWGYDHFPTNCRYARSLHKDILGMTGKFHTHWGDFHSYKNLAALEFECFHSLALTAKCSVGDQMLPDGTLCSTTYDLLGQVYSQVEKKEPWCENATAISDIAVLNPEKFCDPHNLKTQVKCLQGINRILTEGGYQFDIIDSRANLDNYRLVMLPDFITVDDELKKHLESYIEKGGKLIGSYKSGLNEAGTAFSSTMFGVKFHGDAPYSPDFLVPSGAMAEGLNPVEYAMYQRGLQVEPLEGAEVHCETKVPFFNRTREHYCSHMHAPVDPNKAGYPGVIQNRNTFYFVHPVFSQYAENAPYWVKRLVHNAINCLLPDPVLRHSGPSSVIATVNAQQEQDRTVVHLLHYIPETKCEKILVVEDIIPLYQTKVSVREDRQVTKVTCVPELNELDFTSGNGRVEFIVPEINGHQMIELSFK